MDRLLVVGTSKGAEAALLLAVRDPRVDAVVALSPTSVAWEGFGEPGASSWTWRGEPVPFAAYPAQWPDDGEFRGFYRRGLEDAPGAAGIPIERSAAEFVLVAGEDDRMWPSAAFARELAARCPAATVVTHPLAGHRVRLPGEGPAGDTRGFVYGGAATADAELGALAWREIERLVGAWREGTGA